MTAQTYTSLQSTLLANTVKAQPVNGSYDNVTIPPDFANIYPQAISYAENRIYRDLVLLATRQQNISLMTTMGSRTISLVGMSNPSGGPIIIPEGVALITPVGTTTPANGVRVPFDMASLDVIDQFFPTEGALVTPSLNSWGPRYWALRDASTIVYGPTADAAYTVEITGLFQPTPLSASNPSTYLSQIYPEVLEVACMVFLEGALLHNYGSQADEPRQAQSWEGLYQTLIESAKAEEQRRRGLRPDILAAGGGGRPGQ